MKCSDSLGALAISKRSDKSENASVAQFEILENLGDGPEPPFLHYSQTVQSDVGFTLSVNLWDIFLLKIQL